MPHVPAFGKWETTNPIVSNYRYFDRSLSATEAFHVGIRAYKIEGASTSYKALYLWFFILGAYPG